MDNTHGLNGWRRLRPLAVLVAAMAVLALLLLAGCAGNRRERPRTVAVTFAPQADVAAQIAGDSCRIVTLVRPSTDPETYEPSMADMTALQDADLYFTLATPGFERNLLKGLKANFPDLTPVDVSSGMDVVRGTHGDGEADPHLWSSVRNMRVMTRVMTQALSDRYPDDAPAMRRRSAAADCLLQALDAELAATLSPVRGRAFVVMHPSLTYFARDYGLRQIALENEGKETGPRAMRERLDSAAAVRPLLMVVDPAHGAAQALQAARQLGLDTVNVQLNTPGWRGELRRLAGRLRSAGND